MHLFFHSIRTSFTATLAAAFLVATQSLPAQEASSPWKSTGAAGVTLAQGNSDTLSYTLHLLSAYELDNREAKLGADWHYAEDNDVKNTDSFRAFGEYRYLFDDRAYLGANTAYLVDEISEIDFRLDLGVVAGYYLIKDKKQKLSLEIGPGYVWLEQGGISDDYMTMRLALRYERQLARRSKLWLSTSYTPAVEDFSDYLLTTEAGIDTALNDHWAIRTALRHQYDSTPALDRKTSDTLLTFGLRYALGGYPEKEVTSQSNPQASDAKPEAIKKGWTSTAALTLALAEGNSDNLNVTAAYNSAYRSDAGEYFLSASYSYAESDSERSADSVTVRNQYNKLLSEKTYLGMGLDLLRDDIADIDYRATPALTLGHYLIKEEDMTLSFEAGPGYTFEKVGGVSDSYFSLVAGENFVWELNDSVSFKQSLTGHINPSETDDYTLVADMHLDTEINEHLSWRLAASWSYDNTPAVDKDKEDITLSSGIAVKF